MLAAEVTAIIWTHFPWPLMYVVWKNQHGRHHSQLHYTWYVSAMYRRGLQYAPVSCSGGFWPLHLCILRRWDADQGDGDGSCGKKRVSDGNVEWIWLVHRSFRVCVCVWIYQQISNIVYDVNLFTRMIDYWFFYFISFYKPIIVVML